MTEPTDTELRQHLADAIREDACDGDCGDTEEECASKRIQPCVWRHGILTEVLGTPETFADVMLAALSAPVDRSAVLTEAIAAVEAERDATDVNVAVYPRYDGKERMALDSAIRVLRRLANETPQTDIVEHTAEWADTLTTLEETCPES